MIPLRATNLKYSQEWPRYIVIHHTAEMTDNPRFKFDNPKFQAGTYIDHSFKQLHKPETMYHFLVDKVATDFHVIVSQPLLTKCEYSDLKPEYHGAVHVGLIGNYDQDLPPTRLYRVLAYRLLNPIMRMFYLNNKSIVFHSTISDDDSVTCPGEFIEMSKLINQVQAVKRKKSVKRR